MLLSLKPQRELAPCLMCSIIWASLSYMQAISKLKLLSEERLTETKKIAKSKAFMLIWDNLHIKFSHTRMIANEFWGTANSKLPWSLWTVDSLLCRKAKSLPPFRPVYELELTLTLHANILDGFRIYSSNEKLEDWVDAIETL